jgi:hypothetical protein
MPLRKWNHTSWMLLPSFQDEIAASPTRDRRVEGEEEQDRRFDDLKFVECMLDFWREM